MVHSMERQYSVEWVPIEWEEFMEVSLGKYFPRHRREVKVEDFQYQARQYDC